MNSKWDASNIPLEAEHAMDTAHYISGLGTEGTGQLFRDCYLRYTREKDAYAIQLGSTVEALLKRRQELEAQVADLNKQLAEQSKEVPTTPIPPQSTPPDPETLQTLAQVESSLKPLADLYNTVLKLKGN